MLVNRQAINIQQYLENPVFIVRTIEFIIGVHSKRKGA